MVTESRAAGPMRTGPVGRVVRLLMAAALGWLAYDLWADRSFIATDLDPGLLVLTGFAVFGLRRIAGLAGRGGLALLGAAGVAAGAVAVVRAGTVWAAPLSWLVWSLDLGVVLVVAAAALVAVIVGTPGCEVAVFRDITRRLRRESTEVDVVFCLAGLHLLDAWEARQVWHDSARRRGVRDHG